MAGFYRPWQNPGWGATVDKMAFLQLTRFSAGVTLLVRFY